MYELHESDRIRLSNFIEKNYGIQMPPEKKILLQTRLQKRAIHLGYPSLHLYINYLFSPDGQAAELDQFSTIVSTHKTEFFREPKHFTLLHGTILPDLTSENTLGTDQTLVTWSCASSTGEEVYSIAMTVCDFFRKHNNRSPLFKAIGTDISENIVEFARRGIYHGPLLDSIPAEYRHYMMKSRDPARNAIRPVPELRSHTDFRPQNLMDEKYRVQKGIHVIFCRNVLIYFNRQTQESILRKLVTMLATGGYLIIGHSETLSGADLPLRQIQLTIYKKTGDPA